MDTKKIKRASATELGLYLKNSALVKIFTQNCRLAAARVLFSIKAYLIVKDDEKQ